MALPEGNMIKVELRMSCNGLPSPRSSSVVQTMMIVNEKDSLGKFQEVNRKAKNKLNIF